LRPPLGPSALRGDTVSFGADLPANFPQRTPKVNVRLAFLGVFL
jgi:hypothetical protein